MKPLLKIINIQSNESFHILKVHEPCFFPAWHFHPEYEIMLVLEGTGIRFVGDSMERFQPGDLILFGKEIPHYYRSDEKYQQKNSDCISRAAVLYFREDFLGERFWDIPDINHIKILFANSKRGIKFKGKIKEELSRRICDLDEKSSGLAKVIELLSILEVMATTKEYELLSSRGFIHNADEDECKRMNAVYQYILNNYRTNPTLDEVASIANLSTTAFCRYFKSRANKTFKQFLNEIKVGNACKLLIDTEKSISQVCFETGFNNFTNFNSQFKQIIGITPSHYQRKHLAVIKQTVS
jgi:AraC-like DNA-binding protein